jgi:phosphoglycolate phosphatase
MTGGLLFDFDGTLVDTFDDIVEGVQRARRALDARPLEPPEIRRHIGWGARRLIGLCHPRLDPLRPERLPDADTALPIPVDELDAALALFRRHYADVLLRCTRAYPGVPEMCAALARDGFSLAVISNKPERFVRQVMAGLALTDPFRLVVGCETAGRAKPDPAPIVYALERLDLPAQRCIMIGDGRQDLLAAQAAGVTGAAVAWGLVPAAELIPLGPAYLARTVPELETWLRKAQRAIAYRG